MPQVFPIKTWSCKECNYRQDFEPTAENFAIHFKGGQIPAYECPACYLGKNVEGIRKPGKKMKKETVHEKKIKVTVCDEADIDARPGLDVAEKARLKSQRIMDLAMIEDIRDD